MSKTIQQWQADAHELAVLKGWYEEPTKEQRAAKVTMAKIAVMHLNLSAVLEHHRDPKPSLFGPDQLETDVVLEQLDESQIDALARIALMHSELSEAVDCVINGDYEQTGGRGQTLLGVLCDDYTKPEGMVVELADVVIRILDFCGFKKLDLDRSLREKHTYNATRPHRHGGKLA
jgi:hypothetical protein